MKIDEVIEYYGIRNAACNAIGVVRASFTRWENQGYLPLKTQTKFFVKSKGALQIDIDEQVSVELAKHFKSYATTKRYYRLYKGVKC